jgi:hypothetical protein
MFRSKTSVPSTQKVLDPVPTPPLTTIAPQVLARTERKHPPRRKPLLPCEIVLACQEVLHFCTLNETKKVPPFHGTSSPSLLAPHPSYSLIHSEMSLSLQAGLARLFGDKTYAFRLSTSLNMAASGAGLVNSVIQTLAVGSIADFTSLSAVFNEFFVTEMRVRWQPVARYTGPVGTNPIAGPSGNTPLGCSVHEHASAAYTTVALQSNNLMFSYHSTGDPFAKTWRNVESPSSKIMTVESGLTQSWCPVANVADYTGFLQFLSNNTGGAALPASAYLGSFIVDYDVLFRIRQ